MDIAAVPVVSLPFFPQRATGSSHPDPSCFWKHSEILMAFIRFFCVCVYHPGRCSKAIWEGDVSRCKLVVGQELAHFVTLEETEMESLRFILHNEL